MLKIFYLIFSIASTAHWSVEALNLNRAEVVGTFKNNDSYWYEDIAVNGHGDMKPSEPGECGAKDTEYSNYNFMPLYSWSVRLLMKFTGLEFDVSALILSLLYSLALFLIFYWFCADFLDPHKAFWATVVLMILPFHYYFSMMYTESLYLILLLTSFLSIRKNYMAVLGASLFLLPLVRPNGLFMILPLLLYFLEKRSLLSLKSLNFSTLKSNSSIVIFFLPIISMTFYCIHLYSRTGDYFAFIHARRAWCLYTTWPWQAFLNDRSPFILFKSLYLLLFSIFAVYSYKRLPLSFQVLIWINLLLPLTSNLITTPRYISAIFPFSILIGSAMADMNQMKKAMLVSLFLAGHFWSYSLWTANSVLSF